MSKKTVGIHRKNIQASSFEEYVNKLDETEQKEFEKLKDMFDNPHKYRNTDSH